MEIHNLITLWLVLSKRFKVQSSLSHILKAPIGQFIKIQSTVLVSKRFICLMHFCMYLWKYQNSVLGDKIEHWKYKATEANDPPVTCQIECKES